MEIEAIRDVYRQCASPTWRPPGPGGCRCGPGLRNRVPNGQRGGRGLCPPAGAGTERRAVPCRTRRHADGVARGIRAGKKKPVNECLILIDVVAYAREAPVLAKLCNESGRSLVIVTDEMCHWAKNHTDHCDPREHQKRVVPRIDGGDHGGAQPHCRRRRQGELIRDRRAPARLESQGAGLEHILKLPNYPRLNRPGRRSPEPRSLRRHWGCEGSRRRPRWPSSGRGRWAISGSRRPVRAVPRRRR